MNQFKDITIKILFLILDIFVLAYKTGQQIILPNKKRKGNILSGFYVFFMGTIERFFNFEHGSFSIAKVFRQKYIKQGLIIIGAFLFLLSSFEWAENEKLINYRTANNSEQIFSSVEKNKTFKKTASLKSLPATIFIAHANVEYLSISQSTKPSASSIKKYLLIRNIRI